MEQVTIKNVTFNIDSVLKSNFDYAKTAVDKKWDMCFVIDGREGVAKSTLGKMAGFYLSNGDFSVDNIVFTAEQFYEAVDKAKPKTAIVFDEMVMAGLSGDAITGMQKGLIKKFTLIRKKQLYIILIVPYFFMLQKYFALSRTSFLINCYSPNGIDRGFFKLYNYGEKNFLYVVGHKFWHYNPKAKFSFKGTFEDYTGKFIDEEAYEIKKDETIKNMSGTDEEDVKKIIPSKKTAEAFIKVKLSHFYEHESSERRLLDTYKKNLKEYFAKKGKDIYITKEEEEN